MEVNARRFAQGKEPSARKPVFAVVRIACRLKRGKDTCVVMCGFNHHGHINNGLRRDIGQRGAADMFDPQCVRYRRQSLRFTLEARNPGRIMRHEPEVVKSEACVR